MKKYDKVKDVIYCNIEDEGAYEGLQRWLHKVGPLKKYEEDVPFQAVEKALDSVMKKYGFNLLIFHSITDGKSCFSLSVSKPNTQMSEHIYGRTLYETLAKALLLCMTLKGES